MREADWVSAHLFYADDLDVVLVDAVRPLVTDLLAEGTVHGYFFLRYWDGGPHIRLRLLVPGETDRALVCRHVAVYCGRYFREHPSVTRLTPQVYAPMAARLARLERVRSHLRLPLPNNTVRFIPYRREYRRFGRLGAEAAGTVMSAVERHFMESSRVAMALLGAGVRADQRRVAAYTMILLAWLTGDRAGLAPASWTGLDPADLDARYRRQRDRLLTLADIARRLAAGQPTGVASGSLAAWLRSIRTLREELTESTADHVDMVVDTCAHLMSNRLGLPLSDEGCLRYLAARAMTEVQVSALDPPEVAR